jgi:glycosyltransferase involved in cell wall biosynthesis
MATPVFSVIIPTLNEEKFLPKLLDSLTAQSKRSFEVIVVDGSSKDKTQQIAKSYAKKLPLRLVVSPVASLPLQRNLGAKAAKGEWLAFVDADSILLPYFIERSLVYIADTKPKLFSTWAMPDSAVINDAILTLLTNVFWEATVLLKRPVAPGPLTVVRNDLFHDVGGYDESHAFNEDVDLGLRLAKNGAILSMIRETLYVWSMRRIRRESKMKIANQYVMSLLPILLFKRPFKHMPGYIMGGHMYGKKHKKVTKITIRQYEQRLKLLMRELFS